MATVARVSLPTILQAIEDQLVARRVVKDPAQVLWVITDDAPYHHSGFDVVLAPDFGLSTQPNNDGGGRWDTRVRRTVDVFVRTTFLATQGASDKEWVRNHYPVEDAVLESLHGYHPTDENDNLLLIEPMRLTRPDRPRRDRSNKVWGYSVMTFELLYHPDITASDEPPPPPDED